MSSDRDNLLVGIALSALTMCVCQYFQGQQSVSKWERAYWGERRGRARVEQEMKRISNIQLNTDEGFFVQPIGEIHSCYRQCIGTPRQGLLAPASRATILLSSHISPESLVGLEQFSHVWITFKFHLNTNTLKESKNFSSRSTFNAKIKPPMLKKKVGVFATRSPHRPNPVGVTLAKIDRIDKRTRTIHLCGCDLVEGTPVLDVKPYVAAYDTVPAEEFRIPDWIRETVHTRNTVAVLPACLEQVRQLQARLVQYRNAPEAFMQGLIDTLEAEVRSKFQTERRMGDAAQGEPVEVPFDETIVRYLWRGERDFLVVSVELRSARKDLQLVDSKLKGEAAEDLGQGQGQKEKEEQGEDGSPSTTTSTSRDGSSSSRAGDTVGPASADSPQEGEAEDVEGAVFVDATAF